MGSSGEIRLPFNERSSDVCVCVRLIASVARADRLRAYARIWSYGESEPRGFTLLA